MKWKKGEHGRPESVGGRFYVESHWSEKPGYYVLVDTNTRRTERGTKLKVLKTRAAAIVSADRPAGCDVDPLG